VDRPDFDKPNDALQSWFGAMPPGNPPQDPNGK
jgi:hypothetical protein